LFSFQYNVDNDDGVNDDGGGDDDVGDDDDVFSSSSLSLK